MKLLMFKDGSGRRLGVVRGDQLDEVVDLSALTSALGSQELPADLIGLIDAGGETMNRVRELVSS